MAIWDRITSRGNVEDRRGSGLAVGAGGLGVGGIILLLLMNYLGGGDVGDVLGEIYSSSVPQQQFDSGAFEGADEYEVFSSTVLGSNNDMWANIFAKNNLGYREPKLVLFRGATQGACGVSSSAVGPHYCPNDESIYLDETFFDELQTRFKAQGGDVAEAYVISHEVGHHIQNLLGTIDNVSNNEESINLELQADCFAGLWAHSIKDMGVFESDQEISEALDAAAAVGDDRIQQTMEGRVNPENWTHGSSQQRINAFNAGYQTGSVEQCELSSN